MPADYSGGAAADELEAPAEAAPEMAGEGATKDETDEKGRDDTFFMPEFPGSDMLKPGDPLPLRMVGKTADGQIECEVVPPGDGGEPDWKQDLKKSVETVPGGAGIGNGPESMY